MIMHTCAKWNPNTIRVATGNPRLRVYVYVIIGIVVVVDGCSAMQWNLDTSLARDTRLFRFTYTFDG